METRFGANEHGDPQLTIRLEGPDDIFRFALNMLDDQVEFCRAGREALAALRAHAGPDRFDPWARSMLGDAHFETLSGYGYFEHPQED